MVTKTKIFKQSVKKISKKQEYPTLQLKTERDVAMDFAEKVYKKFDKLIKSVALFGSAAKHTNTEGSDIDIVVILDDVLINFDEKTTAWYRESLAEIIKNNPYSKELHINTIRLTTFWEDLYRGDPVIMNILRYGDVLIDFGGFFNPLKILLEKGKIRPSPESIYVCLNRVPIHINNSKQAEMSAIEGIFWAFVDSAHSLLMAIQVLPPSPEHIALLLRDNFVEKKLLNMKYVTWMRDIYNLHRRINHREIKDLEGKIIDEWQNRAEEFLNVTLKLIKEII